MKLSVNPTTKWKNEHKIPVTFQIYSDFECFNKAIQPLDTKMSLEKTKKNWNFLSPKTNWKCILYELWVTLSVMKRVFGAFWSWYSQMFWWQKEKFRS